MGNFNNALADFSKALQIDPQNPIIYANRGYLYRNSEDYKSAIEDYTNEIKYSEEGSIRGFAERAYCYAKLSEYEKGIMDYTTIIEREPNNLHALYNRAITHKCKGNFQEVNVHNLNK